MMAPAGRCRAARARGRKALPALAVAIVLTALLVGCGEPPRNAVLIVIDTLRADVLDEVDTPNLDALARRGDRVDLAWGSATWTVPSVISIFTGSHVREHGWDVYHARMKDQLPPLPDAPTLAEVLHDAGFDTSGLFANAILKWPLGFERGFDRWRYTTDADMPGLVTEEVTGWSDGRRRFLYLHLLGPHEPLTPSPEARKRWQLDAAMAGRAFSLDWVREGGSERDARLETYRRAYRAAVEDADARVGEILAILAPYRDDTLVVVTADHGEMLGDRGRLGHGPSVYEPLTRVPLIAAGAGSLPSRMTGAGVADLVTGTLGVEHVWSVPSDQGLLVSQRAGRLALSPDGRVKGIWSRRGSVRAFEIAGYPEERRIQKEPDALDEARERFLSEVPEGEITATVPVRVDDETLEALRALGYVGDEPEEDGSDDDGP